MRYNKSKKPTLTIGSMIKVPTDQPYKKAEKIAKETLKEKKARLRRERKEREAAQYTQDPPPDTPIASPADQQAAKPVEQPAKAVQQNTTPPVQYVVSAGETLYGIAKRFSTTVDNITKLNNLTSTTLTPGGILLVIPGQTTLQAATPNTPNPVPVPVVHNDTPVVKKDSTLVVAPSVVITKDSSSAERRYNKNRFGLYEKNESGIATWIDDTSLDPTKMLVLHRTLPIGRIIKITNPMTNRTTFAKVVGRFTDNESTKDVIIVMTKNVADALGALDKRFHVNISYGSPNE